MKLIYAYATKLDAFEENLVCIKEKPNNAKKKKEFERAARRKTGRRIIY